MAERKINCAECGRHVGIIRDARLLKDLHFLCDSCNTQRIALKAKARIDDVTKPDIGDLGDVFGDLFGKG